MGKLDDSVFKKNPAIVLKKLLKGMGYTAIVSALTFGVGFMSTLNVSAEHSIFIGLAISFLQTVKKAVEKYEPFKDETMVIKYKK